MYAANAKRRNSSFFNDEQVVHSIIEAHASHDENEEIITLNVSGRRFQTYESTLSRFPHSLLGNKTRREKFFKSDTNEFFFDRHRPSFESILYFYQSKGIMAKPPNIPIHIFINELIFFDVGDEVILKLQVDNGLKEIKKEEPMQPSKTLTVLWQFLEDPKSSKSAKYFAIISVFVILVSLVLFVIETLPSLKARPMNQTINGVTRTIIIPSGHETWLFYSNTAIIVWFTIEFIFRFVCCPSKLRFFIELSNVIDFLSILPYYISILLSSTLGGGGSLAILRVIRVLRVFKLARHSRGLQILGNTLKASFNELMMLAFFLFVMILIFGSCAYFAEYEEPGTKFISIPSSFWWAIVTMTTVGYGDMYPKTFWGQIVGSMAVVCGVLTIALPVPVVVSNFEYFYTKEKNRKRTEDARKEQERQERVLNSHVASNLVPQNFAKRLQHFKGKLSHISSRNSPRETPDLKSPRDINMVEYTPNGSLRRGSVDTIHGPDKFLLRPRLASDNISYVSNV